MTQEQQSNGQEEKSGTYDLTNLDIEIVTVSEDEYTQYEL